MTNARINQLSAAAAILVAAILVPAVAHAQSNDPNERANAIVKQAEQYLAEPSHWSKVADLMKAAGEVQGADEHRSVVRLLGAGNIYYQIGKIQVARDVFMEGAERALANGDIELGAEALHRAAAVAVAQHDANFVREAGERVQRLARSPLLNDQQRARLDGLFTSDRKLAKVN